jgi:hypothetical protein
MALFRYNQFLAASSDQAFDLLHEPGQSAPHAGIYRCENCGDEIGIAKGHTLPPQNHRQHNPNTGRIAWRLVVYAQQQN